MPELPEVEQFRQLLLPLVSSSPTHQHNQKFEIQVVGGENKRILLTTDELRLINKQDYYFCSQVLRKGKQLCLVLQKQQPSSNKSNNNKKNNNDDDEIQYLFLHMGMTGRIRVEGKIENWGGKSLNGEDVKAAIPDGTFPPKYTYLIFTSGNNYKAYFCDPRKFGSCYLARDLSTLDELAPDALDYRGGNQDEDLRIIETRILPQLTSQRLGIKSILLDQKRAVSGVGNWVADEVLYQCGIHPDQIFLSEDEAKYLWETLHSIVQKAVDALKNDTHYPDSWLFGYRWTKKKAGSKDVHGRSLTFLKSGGRTSAIVPSIQILYKRNKGRGAVATKTAANNKAVAAATDDNNRKNKDKDKYSVAPPSASSTKQKKKKVVSPEVEATTAKDANNKRKKRNNAANDRQKTSEDSRKTKQRRSPRFATS